MSTMSMKRQGSPLAEASEQLTILESVDAHSVQPFDQTLREHGLSPLNAGVIETLQINVGKMCNQTCRHCHVDAGPDRREIMTRETMQSCLDAMTRSSIRQVDLTGGAPEMNPHFDWFVAEIRRLDRRVIDRCNLTILTAPGFTHLPEYLAEHEVEIVASLPCYLEENCDAQRGNGVFQRSIEGLRLLNEQGYGHTDSRLSLSLVYNPVGPSLPPDQQQLEGAYREQLRDRFGIEFNRLYTITNMPISRFLDDLIQTKQYEAYMSLLVDSFNPRSVDAVMCRTTLSVDWEGNLYDCDFNQMLELHVDRSRATHINDYDEQSITGRRILTGRHCYGCTAGAGSSCQGALLR
ncbi:MAG: arsenosugar biosynthesis radical SAM protein ArsS [Planctomycetaceae bacterium]|nr:arsenosugar biosynthesis radical SAM protein ArsS [Planctomycetaceae bacterium]